MSTQVKLQNVRIAFCQDLFKAGAMKPEDKPAFSSTFILPKDHPQFKEVVEAMKTAAKEKWGTKWEANYKAVVAAGNVCFRDGDIKAQYDGFEGNYSLSARSYTKPTVKDNNKENLDGSEGRIYAGCYVHALVNTWIYDKPPHAKRICCGLKGVMFYKDGDSFGASSAASDSDFDDLSVDEESVGSADDLMG